MDSKRINICSKDFISNLPEVLISHILSYVPTKEAALTSVLSKRWRYLFAFTPNLDFNDHVNDYYKMDKLKRQEKRTSFQVFVDRVMTLQGNDSVNKFSLRCEKKIDPTSFNRWILNALERGVGELNLHAHYRYRLPSEVLMSKTLVKLKVSDTSGFTNLGDVSLPKLKTLDLDDVKFNENGAAFTKLVSGCPALEELIMGNVCFSCEFLLVSNQTLKRLEVCFDYTDGKPESVSFDTPNLVYLKFDGIAAAVKYPKVKFDSLVEAKIDLEIAHSQDEESANATDLFMGICNVEILYLSRYSLEVLAFSCRAIPVFNNLIHLTVDSDEEVQWKSLPKLLKKCPNLETLVFKGLHQKDRTNDRKPWKVTRRCLSSSPVKMLKVLKFGEFCSYAGDDMYKQKEMIKYFLETMPNLEQAMIYYDETSIDDDDASILLTEFQMLESVASRKCKIQVIPDNISFAPWPLF